jgi:hypothetical protein
MEIPKNIGSLEIVFTAIIDDACKHTKNCEHCVDGKVLGKAKWASITKPDDTGLCYLFLCYIGDVLSDSINESIEDSKSQAEWEYEGISNTWQKAT